MDGKKDPGKFTVRFNIADPQQRAAAEMLNRQGRCKAQFITNAVLYYICAMPDGQAILPLNGAAAQRTVMDTVDSHKNDLSSIGEAALKDAYLEDADKITIYRTTEAFRTI